MSWFGRDKNKPREVLPVERGPLKVALGGAVQLDLLSIEADTLGSEPAMPLPKSGVMVITAYGEVRLDATTTLARYYDDEHRLLQVMYSGDVISDVSIYHPWDSVVPAGSREWDRWLGPNGLIGQPTYDADGIIFNRHWGEGDERSQPVEFTEAVFDGERNRRIHQICMLYGRQLGSIQEMLLIGAERDIDEPGQQQGSSVEFMIGYGIGTADVRRV